MPDNQYATATPANPQLGYGNRGEVSIDAYNQWQRQQPWYQALLKSWGQSPDDVHLNDTQKQAIIRAAQANGVVVDEGGNGQEVDDSGNFRAKGHKLRNTLIVAGLAGAALLTAGAAGAFSGAAASGLGGVEAGAASGLGAASLPGAGTALGTSLGGGAAAAGAGAGAAAAGGSTLSTLAGVGGAATAAKGIPSWLAPVLGSVVPTVGGLVGASIQAGAAKDAAATQAEGIQKALDFEKQQYADLTGRLEPYVAAGTSSTDRMAQLLGLPARPDTTATGTPSRGPAVANYGGDLGASAPAPGVTTQPLVRTAAPPMQAGEPLVTLQAPDGSTKAVPQSQVAHYVAAGAKQIGVAA